MCFCYTPSLPSQTFRPIPASALGYKDKYWEPGTEFLVSVLGGTTAQIDHIMAAASFWSQHAHVYFKYTADFRKADMRVQLAPSLGSWSFIGTDNKFISQDKPTMNLGWIDRDIANADFSTAIHEIGHFLGLGHEHQNPNEPFKWNRQEVIKDLSGPPNYWSIAQIEHNVLRQVPVDEVDATTLDRDSIMMYFFPDRWVLDGKGTQQNKILSKLDREFISIIYPKRRPKSIDQEVASYISDLLYDKRRVDLLSKRQVITTLEALQEYYDPRDRTRFLKTKLKALLYDK